MWREGEVGKKVVRRQEGGGREEEGGGRRQERGREELCVCVCEPVGV